MTRMQYRGIFVAIALLVALMAPLRGGFTDDGFIHIQYASNIATRGEYSFNPGYVSYGTTSPLWVMIQASIGRLFGGGERLIMSSRLISWLAGITSVVLMFSFARSFGLDVWLAWLSMIVLAGHAWFVRWTALGMETSAAVLAVVLVGIASVGGFDKPRKAGLLGLSMAAAALLRPEAYLLLFVYAAAAVWRRPRPAWRCVGATLAVYGALMIPWLVFAVLHIGRLLPNTAGAKSGGMDLNPIVVAHKLFPIARITGSTEGLSILFAALSVLLLGRASRVLSKRCRFIVLWLVALPLSYAVLDIQVLSRYMLLITPFSIVLGFVGLDDIAVRLNWRDHVRRRVAGAVAVAAIAANMILYFGVIVGPTKAFSEDLTHELRALGEFIDRTADRDAVVAAADIGYLAFYSKRHVLDLGGLVDNATHRLREQHDYETIVEEGLFLDLPEYPRVDYFIDRVETPGRFDGRIVKGYGFESVQVYRIRNLGIRKPGPYYYTLYRLYRMTDG